MWGSGCWFGTHRDLDTTGSGADTCFFPGLGVVPTRFRWWPNTDGVVRGREYPPTVMWGSGCWFGTHRDVTTTGSGADSWPGDVGVRVLVRDTSGFVRHRFGGRCFLFPGLGDVPVRCRWWPNADGVGRGRECPIPVMWGSGCWFGTRRDLTVTGSGTDT
jgi:hypothetical protein